MANCRSLWRLFPDASVCCCCYLYFRCQGKGYSRLFSSVLKLAVSKSCCLSFKLKRNEQNPAHLEISKLGNPRATLNWLPPLMFGAHEALNQPKLRRQIVFPKGSCDNMSHFSSSSDILLWHPGATVDVTGNGSQLIPVQRLVLSQGEPSVPEDYTQHQENPQSKPRCHRGT